MSDLAKRAGVRDSEGIILIPEIGHEDLAEMIGCSRPMVSRLIAQMVESGLLARRGKKYVLLKKWDFTDNRCNSQKAVPKLEAVSAGRRLNYAGSSNGSNASAGRRLAVVSARSSS